MVGHQNPGSTGIQQHPATRILRTPESGDIRPPSPDAGGPESGHGQKPAGSGQNCRNPAGSDRIQPLIRSDFIKMVGIRPNLDGSGH
jgi:hypothetical protein